MQRRVLSHPLFTAILAASLFLFTSTFGESVDDYTSDSTTPTHQPTATTAVVCRTSAIMGHLKG